MFLNTFITQLNFNKHVLVVSIPVNNSLPYLCVKLKYNGNGY